MTGPDGTFKAMVTVVNNCDLSPWQLELRGNKIPAELECSGRSASIKKELL